MDNSNNINNNIINEKEENKIEEKKFDIKNIILTQDIMEGYWEKNEETETIINKISDIYEKIKNYLNEKKIEDNLEKILFTFIMIYYIENKEKDLINDYLLILEKGKKYLKKQNLAYNIILNENNL
jgi:rubrerythrin